MDNSIIAEKGNKKITKKTIFFLLLLVVIIVALVIYYYRFKLALMISQPKVFWDMFLTISQLRDFTFLSVITTSSLCGIAFFIDFIAEGWKGSALKKLIVNPTRSSKLDLFCFFLTVTKLFETLQLCLSLGVAYFISSLFFHYCNINLMSQLKVSYLQPIILFVLLDLKHYLEHRLMHHRKLWELHSYHHSATEFTLFTNSRGHLLEESIYFMFTGIFFALMGSAMHELFYFYAFREMYGYLLHADIKSKFGFVGKWILISPQAHKLHHSIKKEDYGHNFGTLFIWWDKLFGTYKEPYTGMKIGLENDLYNEMNFFKGQIIAFRRWINSW